MLIDKIARVPISEILIFAGILTVIRLALFPYLKKTPIHKREGIFKIAKFFNDFADALVYAAVVVFLLIRPFAIQTFHIPSESMVDTLHVKDFIVANKFVYRTRDPKAGEIVVFKPPARATHPDTAGSDFIKRTIGTPGQVIEFIDGELYRDGKKVEEPYYTLTKQSGPNAYRESLEGIAFTQMKERLWDWKLVKYDGKLIPLHYDRATMTANVAPLVVPEYQLEPGQEDVMEQLILSEPQPIPDGYYLMFGDNRNGSDDGRRWGLVPRESIIGKAEFIWFPLARIRKLH